jgi:cytochrome P450
MGDRPQTSESAGNGCARDFDHLAPEFGLRLHDALARLRAEDPVGRSECYGGFWVLTRYEDVLRVAQDWETFSSANGVTVPHMATPLPSIPEEIDPPLHRVYKRLINAYFTPAAVAGYETPTRALVTRLLDDVIEDGACDLMAALARPFPGIAFFELVLNAPAEVVATIAPMASAASNPDNPDIASAFGGMLAWIREFTIERKGQPRRGDIVDAVLAADIDGRPISDDEVCGIIMLIILGGLETTSGALGQFVIRFAQQPEIPSLLRARPELIPTAIEELLRLDPPFIGIARTATRDTVVDGHTIKAGEKVVIYFASANRDDAEFEAPSAFDLERRANRHLSFGAGPHRCAGSNLARLNLRVAVEEIVRRMGDIRLQPGADVRFHNAFNRAPLTVPITFTPGRREAVVAESGGQ